MNFWNIWINVLMKLIENSVISQSSQSQVIIVKPVQSFKNVFRTQSKIWAFVYWIAKTKLHRRCSTSVWIPAPLKLIMKTPEQYQSPCYCAFIVGFQQILYIHIHVYAYLTYFRNSCFHFFEQGNATWEWYQKLKKIDPL